MHNYCPIKKSWVYTLLTGLILSLLLPLSSCKKDKEEPIPPTEAEKVTALLTAGTGTWPLTSVLVEGENAAALFKDFSLTFTATGYTTTGTTPVWARSGTWSFTDDTATKIKRDDNIEVTIVAVDEKTLTLTLFWETEIVTGGRSKALRGKHEFVLSK